MSWQLAAFLILGAALAAGFGWYERGRPDARLVALVATLAALAALGRVAFVAIPNVKPTTDIVLISGYAIGGAPGFAVGALAGLTSNFFLGQGPWTPWQMAGWGLTGLAGALLAVVGGRSRTIPRAPLAAICAVIGFGFTALQDVGDWVNYSDHSAAQLGVYVGKGIGFDFVHAAGCLAFALLFGPALARSLRRFAARTQVRWHPAGAIPVLLCVVLGAQLLALGRPATADAATPESYLLAAQNRDGGFGPAVGAASDPLYTGWAALGLAAIGDNPADIRNGGPSLLDSVRLATANDVGALERTILVVRSGGLSAAGLAAALEGHLRGDGSVADQSNLTAFAVLALRAAGVTASAKTFGWLIAQQNGDGGFGFARGGGSSDVDDTGAVLQALAFAGSPGGHAIARAVRFLRDAQNGDGGFPALPNGESNAQSTAWAVQGLIASGVDPATLGRGSALHFLHSLTAGDGHVRYSRSSDQTPVWVTAQAAMALAGKPLPLSPAARHAVRGHAAAGHSSSAGRARGRARRKRVKAAALSPLLRYASEAGIATALALAPVD